MGWEQKEHLLRSYWIGGGPERDQQHGKRTWGKGGAAQHDIPQRCEKGLQNRLLKRVKKLNVKQKASIGN